MQENSGENIQIVKKSLDCGCNDDDDGGDDDDDDIQEQLSGVHS
jgi:hypothetical protein